MRDPTRTSSASPTLSISGRLALMAGHCAGMLDLVALPLWVGALITAYGLDPQQSGSVVTLFLMGVVLASVATAPLLARIAPRAAVPLGFAVSSGVLLACAELRAPHLLAALHVAAGLGTGVALSMVHGTIGRSPNPHRLFGQAFTAMGVFGMLFLLMTGVLMERFGAAMLFRLFAGVQLIAALVASLAFPHGARAAPIAASPIVSKTKMPTAVWFGMGGVACMTLVQAMTFSFAERIGLERGLASEQVVRVLSIVGIVNIGASVVATQAQRRIGVRTVLLAGPALQALLAATIAFAGSARIYVPALLLFVAVLIVTHTFVFGLLAQLDSSGRATAATPAMTMLGSALGPILAGTMVKVAGFGALGVLSVLLDVVALACLLQLARDASPAAVPLPTIQTHRCRHASGPWRVLHLPERA